MVIPNNVDRKEWVFEYGYPMDDEEKGNGYAIMVTRRMTKNEGRNDTN